MAELSESGYTVPLPQIEGDKSESWVQILPSGVFNLNDGRGPWVVKDMAAVIERSRADLARGGIPVDMDHALERRNQTEAPAAGWIEELAARVDGIWARIAWTPTGKAKITGREYRFISPVLMVNTAGEVAAVVGAGLTNAPAITMKAICSVEDDTPKADLPADDAASVLAMLREAFGVPAETPIAELIRRARAVSATAGGTKTDNSAVREIASSYMKLLTEIHDDKVEAALERARSSGRLVPVMENWARELASSNLPAFEAWEACAIPAITLGGSGLASRKPPSSRFAGSENSERRAVCAQLGIPVGEEE